MHFVEDGVGGRQRISRAGNGPAHHKIVRAGRHGGGRRHDAALIVRAGGRRTDARTQAAQPRMPRLDGGRLLPGTDDAVQLPAVGHASKRAGKIRRSLWYARHLSRAETRQHGNAEDQRRPPAGGGGGHGFAAAPVG